LGNLLALMMARCDSESKLAPPCDRVCTRQFDHRRCRQVLGGRVRGSTGHRIALPNVMDQRIPAQHEPALQCDGALHRLPNTPRCAVTWAAGFVTK